jgi:hypothetical protein
MTPAESSLVQEICLHHPLALDLDHSPPFELETIAKRGSRRRRNLNAAGRRVGFHAACGVHGVAPHIVDELVRANDPGCDRRPQI